MAYVTESKQAITKEVRFNITPQIGESLHALRGYQGIVDQFPGDPWMHLSNTYLEVSRYVKNNQGMSVTGGMFISYDRISTRN